LIDLNASCDEIGQGCTRVWRCVSRRTRFATQEEIMSTISLNLETDIVVLAQSVGQAGAA
jgi:hypothetical protein